AALFDPCRPYWAVCRDESDLAFGNRVPVKCHRSAYRRTLNWIAVASHDDSDPCNHGHRLKLLRSERVHKTSYPLKKSWKSSAACGSCYCSAESDSPPSRVVNALSVF